ncbi:MAG: pyridoxamine 5'-phosphate oxidase family protein [Actinomadura sp.]
MTAGGGDHARATVRPGDVGRRALRRRRELGLSRTELAMRAGMAPEFVAYLEEQPAQLTVAALLHLADALETTPAALLGGDVDRPPGQNGAGRRSRLEPLTEDECRRLLSAGGVGRVLIVTESGPEALPVNFTMIDDQVVFRTAPDTVMAAHIDDDVGFEVDRLDEALSQGWSVLIGGRARRIYDPAVFWKARDMVDPWAGGRRDLCVQIETARISGRRVIAD